MTDSQIIDRERVQQIATLARLHLAEAELDSLTVDLGRILEYVDKLNELDTSAVEPTTHAIELPTHYRPDEPRAGLSTEAALGGAPERIGDGFGVPKIIE